MELVVLGVGGGWPRAGGAACGYLVREDGFNLWLDLGTGTMANLQQHVALADVHAVAISHRHFDHFLDLYPFYLSGWWPADERRDPIPLYCPPGMFEHAVQLEPGLLDAFVVRTVEPGGTFEAGPLRIDTRSMTHPVPTLGMRVSANGSSLAYSADTGPTDELVTLARGADALLSEATWLERRGRDLIHLTPSEAAQHATRADVGRLILTHIWPSSDRGEAGEQATRDFSGPVDVAEEGMRVVL